MSAVLHDPATLAPVEPATVAKLVEPPLVASSPGVAEVVLAGLALRAIQALRGATAPSSS